MHSTLRRTTVASLLLLGCACAPAAAAPPAPTRFKVSLSEAGVYHLTYEELAAAGLPAPVPSAGLALTTAGRPVPIWVADGDDGRFGPGDAVEFIGQRLHGEVSYFQQYSDENVYWLDVAAPAAPPPARMRAGDRDAAVATCAPPGAAPLTATQHLERDLLRVRFDSSDGKPQEVWFWARLSQIDASPIEQTLDLGDLDPTAAAGVDLKIHFRGWSHPPDLAHRQVVDHHVEIALNGVAVGAAEWNNSPQGFLFELDGLPASSFKAGANTLSLRIPERTPPGAKDPLIDVVLLNWIEIAYPRSAQVAAPQAELTLGGAPAAPDCWTLTSPLGSKLVVYGPDGGRYARDYRPSVSADGRRLQRVTSGGAAGAFDVVTDGQWLSPERVAVAAPAHLTGRDQQADYLMIAHPTLIDAIQPLADFYRGRGLRVQVISIDDVYDEFSSGIVHPRAIRDFVRYAYRSWKRPAPRFVLLVGDASWDAKSAQGHDENYADWTFQPYEKKVGGFAKNGSVPYSPEALHRNRDLVPTSSFGTSEGYAASDTWFVTVAGDDDDPDLAIGRFPVVEPAEVKAIVDKTIRYASQPPPGDWRRRVLLISDGTSKRDRTSDQLAGELAAHGFAGVKVQPGHDVPTTERNRNEIREALDQGDLLVHFTGHGGRYIWRTAPADYRRSLDLFGLDDLDRLIPNERLPVVLSMTCYSAPFDHPTADSIGEKFLRMPDRGAIGVVAASWRTAVSRLSSELLLEEFTRPGATMGEALQRAKHRSRDRRLIYMFNLLGDPALPLAIPRLPVDVELLAGEPPRVRAAVPAEAGRALDVTVEWVNAAGDVVDSQQRSGVGPSLEAAYAGDPSRRGELAAVSVYLRDERSGAEGVGGVKLGKPAAAAAQPAPSPSEGKESER
jgi:Peptidase family C25